MSESKRNLIGWAGAAITLLVLVVVVLPRLFLPDFKDELAKKLGVGAEFLHINIPPAAQRKPGFTFVVRGSVLPVMYPESDDESIREGAEFSIGWSTLTGSNSSGAVGAGGFLNSLVSQNLDDKISFRATDCRILELPLADVRQRLLESEAALDAADTGQELFVVVRSYIGRIELKVHRASDVSAKAWAEQLSEVQAGLDNVEAEVSGSSDRELLISWQTPTVFAYEAMEAKFLTTHLGTRPDSVQLKKVPVDGFSDGLNQSSPAEAIIEKKN